MNTKLKILRVAASEFSKNGYRSTTIRKICKKADVNLALINYHFGGKRKLYKEVVDYLVRKDPTFGQKIISKYENDEEWETGLYNYILTLLLKITDSSHYKSCLHKIIFREILDPSDLFAEFYNEYFIIKIEELKELLLYKINPEVNKETFDIIIFSVISQCLFYGQNKSIISQYYSSEKFIDIKISSANIAKNIMFQVRETLEVRKRPNQ